LLLLYGEQGFGDVIQFSRFVPQAIESGGQILLSVRPELVTLFWVALSVFHDWRYGVSGNLTPWYESARVFKQTQPGEWSDVISRMITSLRQFTV
jgi:hypothetical protein